MPEQMEMKVEDGALVVDPPKKEIDWELYYCSATVKASQEMAIDDDGIDWSSVEVNETLEVDLYRVPDTIGAGHIWIATLNVEGLKDEEIIAAVRKRIEEYEENEA